MGVLWFDSILAWIVIDACSVIAVIWQAVGNFWASEAIFGNTKNFVRSKSLKSDLGRADIDSDILRTAIVPSILEDQICSQQMPDSYIILTSILSRVVVKIKGFSLTCQAKFIVSGLEGSVWFSSIDIWWVRYDVLDIVRVWIRSFVVSSICRIHNRQYRKHNCSRCHSGHPRIGYDPSCSSTYGYVYLN
jgi:hypothetical protein